MRKPQTSKCGPEILPWILNWLSYPYDINETSQRWESPHHVPPSFSFVPHHGQPQKLISSDGLSVPVTWTLVWDSNAWLPLLVQSFICAWPALSDRAGRSKIVFDALAIRRSDAVALVLDLKVRCSYMPLKVCLCTPPDIIIKIFVSPSMFSWWPLNFLIAIVTVNIVVQCGMWISIGKIRC